MPTKQMMTPEQKADQRTAREIAADANEREALRQAAKTAFVKQRGAELYDAWLEGVREGWREVAADEFDETQPPWTFERVAEIRLKSSCRDAEYRARAVAHLSAIHAECESAPAHTPISGVQFMADGPKKLKAV